MIKAICNDRIIAESAERVVVEGNHYFPSRSVKAEYLGESSTTALCGWKGTARYHDLIVDGHTNLGAACYYSTPKEAAQQIQGRIVFWKGVQVIDG